MNNFIITTDYGTDINEYFFKKYNISRIPFPVFLNGQPYVNQNYHDFYQQMRTGAAVPSTSLINPEEAISFLENFLARGMDIIHITLSSGITGTYNSFLTAAENLKEKYPNRKIAIIDSLCASAGQGLLYIKALELQQAGKSYDEVNTWVLNNRLNIIHLFTVDSLFYLQRTGRVSKTTAIIGTALGVKPIMYVDNNGKLLVKSKVSGRRNSIDTMTNWISQLYDNTNNPFVFIAHADCAEDAQYFAEVIQKQYSCDVYIAEISPLIGAHSGPGTLHVAFYGSARP